MSASIIPMPRTRGRRSVGDAAAAFAAELDVWTARARRRLDGLDEGGVPREQLRDLVIAGGELCDIAAEIVWTLAAELEQAGPDAGARRAAAELGPRVRAATSALAAAALSVDELEGQE